MKKGLKRFIATIIMSIILLTNNGTLVLATEITENLTEEPAVAQEVVASEPVQQEETAPPEASATQPEPAVEAPKSSEPVVTEPASLPSNEAISDAQNTAEEAKPETQTTEVTTPQENVSEEIQDETVPEAVQEEAQEEPKEEPKVQEDVLPNDAEETDEEENKEEVILDAEPREFIGHVNSVDVKVTAEPNTFPVGTTWEVKEVSKEQVIGDVEKAIGETVEDVKAVDITFFSNGVEVQPAKAVKVELTTTAFQSNEDLKVVHIEEPGKAEKMNLTEATDTKATFNTDGFSVYVVVDTGDDARLTVNFKNGNENTNTLVSSAQIKKNDIKPGNDKIDQIVTDPTFTGLQSDEVFKGWTTDPNYTVGADGNVSGLMDITGVRNDIKTRLNAGITDGTEVNYYAVITKTYYVNYLDDRRASLGGSELSFRADYSVSNKQPEMDYTVNKAYTPDNTHDFEGWLVIGGTGANINGYTEGKAYTNGTPIVIKGNVIFSVNAPEGNWLIFNENGKGATYNAPQFVIGSDVTKEPTLDMVRNGYEFGGWYTDQACTDGNEFTFGGTISSTTTIYAKWISKITADYTVLIWKENIAGDGYDFEEAIHLNGNVGSTINTVTRQGNGDNAYARVNNVNKQYTGFHLKEFDQNVTIATEGNSVLNIYYERTTYTLTFRRNKSSGTVYKTITEKYGRDIKSNFPISVNGDTEYRWQPHNSSTFNQVLVYIDIMPAENITFSRSDSDASTKYMEFYVEALPGQTPDRTFNGRNFVKHGNTIPAKYNWFTYAEDFIELSGFNRFGSDPAFGSNGRANVSDGGTLRLYYTRKAYPINFMDGKYVDGNGNLIDETDRGQLSTTENILYEANISSYNTYQPTTIPAGYAFEGWYIDSACTHPYTFDKMPEGGITVYAKWRQIQYRVFLHPNVPSSDSTLSWGSDTQATNFRVSYGGKVSTPTGIRAEYEFVGWFLENGSPFNGDAFILNDTNVTTTYNKETDLTDPSDKYGNENATSNSDVDRFWITRKLDLYANWREKIDGAKGIGVEYDANGGSNAPTDTTLYVDHAKASAGTAPTAPTGKVFDKWEIQTWNGTKYEGTGTYVYAGNTFDVLKSNAKALVYKWVNPNNEEDVLEVSNPTPGTTAPDSIHTSIKEATYTVQLKAVYKDIEEETPTHIYWYRNDGTQEPEYKNENIKINESVRIPNALERDGYTFVGWIKVSEPLSAYSGLPGDTFLSYSNGKYYYNGSEATYVAADEINPHEALAAKWEAKTDTPYKVEYYYEANGTYSTTATSSVQRTGTTDTTVSVTDEDKEPTQSGYIFDEGASNVLSGKIAGDGSLVLKVYFKQKFTVTYEPGEHGTFATQTKSGLNYSQITPPFEGDKTGEAGYIFTGWAPTVADTVTADATYVAQWTESEVPYYVEHYQQNLDGTFPTDPTDTDTITGNKLGDNVTATPKTGGTYTGFTLDLSIDGTKNMGTVTAEYNDDGETVGTLVLKLYYVRNVYKVEYQPGTQGTFDTQTYNSVKYGATTPEFQGDKTGNPGYTFTGWSPKVADTVTANATYVAQWSVNTDTKYKVEYYYQTNGAYPDTADDSDERTGTTDTTVSVTDEDKEPTQDGYVFDSAAANVLSGNIAGDGSLVLKVYFKQQFTVEYKKGDHGTFTETKTENIDYGTATPTAPETTGEAGYTFTGWSPEVAATVTANATYVAQWSANTNTKYTVEYYYQVDGAYPETATSSDTTRTGTTDTNVEIRESDKTPTQDGYVFDEEAGNVLSGNIAGDGSLVLKVYFKQQFKVTYTKGDHGTFDDEVTNNIDYGTTTPAFSSTTPAGEEGYTFTGWSPEVADTVTANATYVAQWSANTNTKYTVEYYYQVDGEYPTEATSKDETRTGTTDTLAEVTNDDKTPTQDGYVFDEEAGNVLSGNIAGDGSLVLKVYFKQQFTVEYKKGDHGTLTETKTENIDYGTATPAAPETTGDAGYTFTGWSPEVADTVTADATYVAQWSANTDTKYKVEHYKETTDGGYELAETENLTGTTDTTATATPKDYTGYTFESDNPNNYLSGNIAGDGSLILKVYYAIDKYNDDPNGPDDPDSGDDIPDKYQVLLTFYVENGKWDDVDSKDPRYDVITLAEKNEDGSFKLDENGHMIPTETGAVEEVPLVGNSPDEGYDPVGEWDKKIPETVTMEDDKSEFTFTYLVDKYNDDPDGPDDPTGGDGIPDKYQVLLTFYVENGKWDDVDSKDPRYDVITLAEKNEDGSFKLDENGHMIPTETGAVEEVPLVGNTPDDGYDPIGEWDKKIPETVTMEDDKSEFTFTYLVDKYNDDPDGPDDPTGGDGIPDKYQVLLTFYVENGKWDDVDSKDPRYDVITLAEKNEDGSFKLDENGHMIPTETGAVEEVPLVGNTPDIGYKAGNWDKEIPEAMYLEDDGSEYTYTYEKYKPVESDPPVKKNIIGDTPETAATFKFTLEAIETTSGVEEMPMPEGSNGTKKVKEVKGAGEYEFGIISFEAPGVYTYKITEENTGTVGYKYDTSTYTVQYIIEDVDGELTCERSITKDGDEANEVVFNNEYTKPSGGSSTPGESNPLGAPQVVTAGFVKTGDNATIYFIILVIAIFSLAISFKIEPKTEKTSKKIYK